MTGLIYVVIIALWAAVLIPIWLRRHDQVSQTRSTQKFSTAMKSLADSSSGLDADVDPRMRGRTTHPAQHDEHSAMARYGSRDEDSRDQRRRSAALQRDNSARVAAERDDPRSQHRDERSTQRNSRASRTTEAPMPDRGRRDVAASTTQHMIVQARRRATRRRWVTALVLMAVSALTAIAAYLGYAPRMVVAIPLALLAVFVIASLASAPARAARRNALLEMTVGANTRAARDERRERSGGHARGQESWDPRDANIPSSVVGSASERARRDSRRVSQPAARVGQRVGMAPDLLESAHVARSQRRAPSRVTFEDDERDQDTASVPAIRGYVDGLRRAANDS